MKKVLIISPYFFEPHRWMMSAYKTALNLSKKTQVVVLTTGKNQFEQVNPNLRVYRMWDIFLPDPINYSVVPGLIPWIEKVISIENPDVFLVNKHMFFTSFAIAWLKLRGRRVICATDTFPGVNWFPKNRFVDLVMRIYAHLIGTPLLKMADKVVLFYEDLEAIAKKWRLNYQVIHNGVDLDTVTTAKPLKLAGKIKIGYVGRLESIKGYYDLLEVAKKYRTQKDIHFYIVGNTQGKNELMASFKRFINIHFLGHREDVPRILKSLDIFVMPSYSEGLPNALMEAMATGCSCIASNVGGMKFLIKHQKNGLLFKPGDLKDLKEQIDRLITNHDLRHSLGDNARRTIERDFDWKKITQRYLELFEEIKK